MKYFKKCISVVLVVIMALTYLFNCSIPVNAEDNSFKNEDKAKMLYEMGLYKGVSESAFEPDLGSQLTREQGIVMIVRLLSKEADAAALTDVEVDSILNSFTDGKEVGLVYRKAVAYVIKNSLVKGDGISINPKDSLTGKQYATIILRNLGFKDSEFSYDTACTYLADKKGCTQEDAVLLNDKVLIRDDMAGLSFGSLTVISKDGSKLIDKLISAKPELKDIAAKAGLLNNGEVISTPSATLGVTPGATSTVATTGSTGNSSHKNKHSIPTPTPEVTPTSTPTGTPLPDVQDDLDFSAAVIGAKKLELSFNKTINAKEASIALTKAGTETVILNTYASKDNTKIYVETAVKLSKGDYEISVVGLEDNTITKTINAEDEKLDKIEFTSDKAVIVPVLDDAHENLSVYVYFKLLNQYGEDITDSYSSYSGNIEWYTTSVDKVNDDYADRGKIILTNDEDEFIYGESLSVSIVYDNTETVVTASKGLTVESKAGVGEIKIVKLYNDNNNKLTVNSIFSSYYLLFDLKDQYGNVISFDADEALIKDDLYVSTSNSSVVTFTHDYNHAYDFKKLVIDGVDYIALPIEKPYNAQSGEAIVSVVSMTTGIISQYTVEVGDPQYAASFTMHEPELAVIGEKIVIPFTAYDADGNEITDFDVLTCTEDYAVNLDVAGANNNYFYFERNPSTGKAELIFNTVALAGKLEEDDIITLTSMTGKTYMTSSINLIMKAPRQPAIAGLSSSYYNKIVQGSFAELKYDKLIFEDNYDRTISYGELRYQLISNLGVTTTGNTTYTAGRYRIAVSSNSDKVKVIGGYGVAEDVYCIGYNPADGRFYEKVYIYGAAEGTAAISVQMQENMNYGINSYADWKNVADAGYNFNMTTIDREDIKSIDVDTIPTSYDYNWYDDNNNNYGLMKTRSYANTFSVYGVLSDGSKAWLSQEILPGDTVDVVNAYTISFSTDYSTKLTTKEDSSVVGDVYNACYMQRFTFTNSTDTLNDDEDESVTVPFSIIPNSTYFYNVDSISRSFTVSSADPKITSIALTYNQFAQLSSDGVSIEINAKDLNTLKIWASNDMSKVILKIVADAVIIKDQYGKEHDKEQLFGDIYNIEFLESEELNYEGDSIEVTVITNSGNKSIKFRISVK